MSQAMVFPAEEDEMVSLAVPRRYYGAVVRALAEAMTSGASDGSALISREAQDGVNGYPHQDWSREDVRRLKQEVHNPTVRAIFDLSVEREGEWISIRELERHTGRRFGQVRADLAGLTRLCKRKFGRSNWPVIVEWVADDEPHCSYRVPIDVARWWQEA